MQRLTTCRYFRDVTWTLTSFPDNRTTQTVHCVCPKSSVAYIFRHEPFDSDSGTGYKYMFACSPESVSKPVSACRRQRVRSTFALLCPRAALALLYCATAAPLSAQRAVPPLHSQEAG